MSTEAGQKKGLFVVVEGIDGAGTTTLSKSLWASVQAAGHQAFFTAQPSTGPFGIAARALMASPPGTLYFEQLALLFATDRLDHLRKEIIPALDRASVVICDRYRLSSLAYQSLHVDETFVRTINQFAVVPDFEILVDVPVEIAIDRISGRNGTQDVFERGDLLQRARTNYLRLAHAEGIPVVDGSQNADDVHQAVWNLICDRLN